MSASFTVTDVPIQVYLGDQTTVSLVNDGPYTIFFDENPGVSAVNGFSLPPTGQMTWKSNKPLWAATQSFVSGLPTELTTFLAGGKIFPKAVLRSSIAGELSLTTRAKFFRQLTANPGDGGTAGALFIETGHCQNLIVYVTVPTASAGSITGTPLFQTLWFDESLNLIDTQRWAARMAGANAGDLPPLNMVTPTLRVAMPVRGKYLGLNDGYVACAGRRVLVIGTDSDVLASNNGGVIVSGINVGASASQVGREILVTGWDGTGGFVFPMMGDRMRIGVSNPGAATVLVLGDSIAGGRMGIVNVPAGGDVYAEFLFPIDMSLSMIAVGGVANMTMTVSWPNDTISS